jgi:hypothetical protein
MLVYGIAPAITPPVGEIAEPTIATEPVVFAISLTLLEQPTIKKFRSANNKNA